MSVLRFAFFQQGAFRKTTWHASTTSAWRFDTFVDPSPLKVLITRVREEVDPEVILLDCRTGLSGLSASAMFHVSDVIVCFLPVSKQSLEGLDIFLGALHSAKSQRNGRPEVLLVPSMVPEGPEGQETLREFVNSIEERYIKRFDLKSEENPDIEEIVPIVREGLEYRRGIALADHVRSDFIQRSAGVYWPLFESLDDLLALRPSTPSKPINAEKVLEELHHHAELDKLAFAESASENLLISKFIKPTDFNAIVDRSTWYVVGSKGSGKTWLWRYLIAHGGSMTDASRGRPTNKRPTGTALRLNLAPNRP